MIERIQGAQTTPQQVDLNRLRMQSSGASFQQMLDQRLEQADGVRLSRHAQARVQQRGIDVTPELLRDLTASVDRADAKGARDIVIISPRQAFIVNVPSRLVVTAMTMDEMKDNVFTKIDGAVIL